MINGELRALSADFLCNRGELYDLAELQPAFEPGRREKLLGEIKSRQYAAFAILMDRLIDDVETARLANPERSFAPSPYRHRAKGEYSKLRLDALKVFIECAEPLEDSPECKFAERLSELRARLDPERTIDPIGQLIAGSDTAISTMLTVLRNMPNILGYHEAEHDGVQIKDIAQNSIGLPWNIAMISIDQMMALQATLAGQPTHRGWSTPDDIIFDPSHFKVIYKKEAAHAVQFTDIHKLMIPSGYRYMAEDEPLMDDIELASYPPGSPSGDIIGCPITLLPKRMHKIWQWFIDDVENAGLWASD